MTGREKARVLPEPVLSLALTSLPAAMASKVRYWMGKRALMPLPYNTSIIFLLLRKRRNAPGYCCYSSTRVSSSSPRNRFAGLALEMKASRNRLLISVSNIIGQMQVSNISHTAIYESNI
jgi:hypothetical protein